MLRIANPRNAWTGALNACDEGAAPEVWGADWGAVGVPIWARFGVRFGTQGHRQRQA